MFVFIIINAIGIIFYFRFLQPFWSHDIFKIILIYVCCSEISILLVKFTNYFADGQEILSALAKGNISDMGPVHMW